jgi:pyruvate kinase
MDRFTKIVATIGPASSDEPVLRQLISSGLDVARLNFSHGTHESHGQAIDRLRTLSAELEKPVTILQDLQGPKLRVGIMPEGGLELTAGQNLLLAPITTKGDSFYLVDGLPVIPMDVPDLAGSVSVGKNILMDDGHLELVVTEVRGDMVETEVILGGILTSHKGVNLPGSKLDIASFTEKDHQDLIFGLENGVDALAISYVRTAQDVEVVRRAILEIDPDQVNLPIVAKLEHPDALDNLDEIIQAAEGVMVARGDLAVETSPERVPIMQKRIISAANRFGKLVITATQMLESMISNPRPTRAEASDVANAIFDGTDAVMLSAESAIGKYPVESVQMMSTIAREAEANLEQWSLPPSLAKETNEDDATSVAHAAQELAHARQVACIAVFTKTGRTALLTSKTRPRVPILAFTPDPRTYQRLGLYRGVKPYLAPFANSVEEMLSHVESALLKTSILSPGQQVVVVSGFPVGEVRLPNFTLLHTVESTSNIEENA